MRAFAPSRQALSNEQKSLRALHDAREALIGYALRHGRFPRPAISAKDGREAVQPCLDAQTCTGFLPWVTLGVGKADGWGMLLRYSVTKAYVEERIQIGQSVADKQIRGRHPDGQAYFKVGGDQCNLISECSPVIVMASGKLGPATSTEGIPRTFPGGADEQANFIGNQVFYSRATSSSETPEDQQFDDLVISIPLRTLYLPLNRTVTERR